MIRLTVWQHNLTWTWQWQYDLNFEVKKFNIFMLDANGPQNSQCTNNLKSFKSLSIN